MIGVTGCTPKLTPLSGAPVPAERFPRTATAPGHRKVVFNWELRDQDVDTRGEGVARIAAPDSARLDFFLGGGFGGGAAVLIENSLQVSGGESVRHLVPPPTLLWAALGRVALPNLPDTVIRVEGGTLRADIGRPVAWRLSFHGDSLFRVERVAGGRVAEWIDRSDPSHVRYRDEGARRSLQLTITRSDEVPEFDASIWRIDR
ncbi:MAG TPA: hypothetical protein VL524_17670 [Gemmatimonadaceae bacterium]|nr:hypothetical protein [Gemmatimonadaceae bacterium]